MVELVLAAVPESGPREYVRTSISRNTHTKMVHLQPHCSTLAFTSVEVMENVEWPDMHGWSIFVIIESPELDSILQGCFATYRTNGSCRDWPHAGRLDQLRRKPEEAGKQVNQFIRVTR